MVAWLVAMWLLCWVVVGASELSKGDRICSWTIRLIKWSCDRVALRCVSRWAGQFILCQFGFLFVRGLRVGFHSSTFLVATLYIFHFTGWLPRLFWPATRRLPQKPQRMIIQLPNIWLLFDRSFIACFADHHILRLCCYCWPLESCKSYP